MKPSLRTVAALLMCLLALQPPVFAQSEMPSRVTVDDYRAIIHDLRQTLQKNPPAAERDKMATRLRAVQIIVLPDGTTLRVSNQETVERIRSASKPKARAALGQRLGALEESLAVSHSSASGDLREEAARILAGSEFQNKTGADEKSWLDRLGESIIRGIENFLRWIFGNSPRAGGDSLGWLGAGGRFFLYLLAAVAGGIALYFLVRFGTAYQQKQRKKADDADLADKSILDPLGDARRLAAEGDLRGAVRLVYIAALRRLQQNGLLILEPDKTNWEYQRMLRSRSQSAYEILLPATRLFDFVWYGGRAATMDEYNRLLQIHDSLPAAPGSATSGEVQP